MLLGFAEETTIQKWWSGLQKHRKDLR